MPVYHSSSHAHTNMAVSWEASRSFLQVRMGQAEPCATQLQYTPTLTVPTQTRRGAGIGFHKLCSNDTMPTPTRAQQQGKAQDSCDEERTRPQAPWQRYAPTPAQHKPSTNTRPAPTRPAIRCTAHKDEGRAGKRTSTSTSSVTTPRDPLTRRGWKA